MAVLAGRNADIYITSGTGTSMTGEAVTSLGSGAYQITDAAKRAINPNASLTVLDGVSTVSQSNYQVSFGAGIITLNPGVTLAGTMTVAGEYLTLAQAAQGFEWTYDSELVLEESQTFGDAWKERSLVMRSGTVQFQRFYNDEYFLTNVGNYFVLALYFDLAGADRLLCAARMTSAGVAVEENALIKQNVSFATHGGVAVAT